MPDPTVEPGSCRLGRLGGPGDWPWPALVMAVVLTGCALPSISSPRSESASGSETASGSEIGSGAGQPARLVRVVDGDSVELDMDGGSTDVRLAGYNAPELYGPMADGTGEAKTCNGEAAKAALAELLGRGSMTVVGDEVDRFGRRLADLVVDGRSVTTEMIEQGWGLAIGDDPENRDLMKRAAARGQGLWGDRCGIALDHGLVLGETQVDPAGSDRDNLGDEWVTVTNESASPIDLVGWVIRDDTTGHRFPLSGVLAEGRQLVIRSGIGTSSETDHYLNETFPVWSNGGETVLLVDPSGVVADWAFVD